MNIEMFSLLGGKCKDVFGFRLFTVLFFFVFFRFVPPFELH